GWGSKRLVPTTVPMATLDLPACLAAAQTAARQAAVILESWRARFSVREKGRADLVTEADVASQKAVREFLLGRFPDHDFLGEEGDRLPPPTLPSPAAG